MLALLFLLAGGDTIPHRVPSSPEATISPLALGDSLFHHGFYPAAAAEYRRASFASSLPDDSAGSERRRVAARAALRLGLSLGAAGDLAGASDALRHAADADPELAEDAGMALAGFCVRQGRCADARLELSDLILFTRDSARRAALLSSAAWLEPWGHDSASCPLRRGRGRSATVAMLLSSFAPGTGEMYAGRPGSGLLNLLVSGGSAAGVYWAAKSDDWVTAGIIASTLFLRFYNGSRQNAAAFAREFNQRLVRRRVDELRAGISEPDWFAGVREFAGPGFPVRSDSPAGAASRPRP
jgi:TM2 domain-containing membrane protein YozV